MRLNMDWDSITFEEFLRRLEYVRKHFPMKHIETEESAGGKGYHVTIYGLNITKEQSLKLRAKFWDDPKRLSIDRQRSSQNLPIGILFNVKRGKHARKY